MSRLDLLAGVARTVISPPQGIYLIGYGDRAKSNCGVHDDISATALVLDDGLVQLALVALDILCMNEFIVDRIRQAVEPSIYPILCCSHTHAGPIAYADEHSPQKNRTFVDHLVHKIIEVIQSASRQTQPAELCFSNSHSDISVNRRELTPSGEIIIGINPDGPVDQSVSLVSVKTATGERLATVVNYACHGTVLGPDNLMVSADWIGAMRQRLESEVGGLTIFLQGATADLRPKRSKVLMNRWELLREQGERVAEAAIDAAMGPQAMLEVVPLKLMRKEFPLAFDAKVSSSKPPKVYRRRLLKIAELPEFLWPITDRLLTKRYPWRSRLAPGTDELAGRWSVPIRVNVARIGELAFVSYGAEVFTQIGSQVKADSPAKHTLFVGVSDGCIGYLPTAQAYSEGGYEIDIAPYAYRFPSRLAVDSAERTLKVTGWILAELFDDYVS